MISGWKQKKSGYPESANIPMTMGFYNREDIPFYYSLADAFTVCDQHFCSSLTGTTPNRLFFWTGTIREQQHENTYPNVWNENVDFGSEVSWPSFPERLEEHGVSWKIYQNEISMPMGLTDEEDAWLSNFGDSPLQWFLQYNVRFSPNYISFINKQATLLPGQIETMEERLRGLLPKTKEALELKTKLKQAIRFLETIKTEQKKYTAENFERLSPLEKNLHQKAFTNNQGDPDYLKLDTLKYNDQGTEREFRVPKGDILHQFRQDVKSNNLPTVSWLVAPEHFSDHPSSAWYGAWYISEVLEILTQNPEQWKKTIFIVTYDENDGYFDHVPPFVAPDPKRTSTGKTSAGVNASAEYVTVEQQLLKKDYPANELRESAIGLGYRVPLVIASPWSRGGWVNSQVFDHTSPLQFLEKFLSHKLGKKVEEPNISEWRRTVCGDLSSVFRPYNGEPIHQPAFLERDPFLESIHQAQFRKLVTGYNALTQSEMDSVKQHPLTSEWLPKQEKGIRPATALPYELYSDGSLDTARRNFLINLICSNQHFGKDSAGSPFYVYAPGKYRSDDQHEYENARSWNYAVAAGEQLNDSWPVENFENGLYHLRVYGPNGFYREFKGSAVDPLLVTGFEYETGPKKNITGNIILTLTNTDPQNSLLLEIRDNVYKAPSQQKQIKPGSALTISLKKRKESWLVRFQHPGKRTCPI